MIIISIRSARERSGLTQAQVAQRLGIHQTNLVAWEHGKWNPLTKRLVQLSQILNCTVDELVTPDVKEDKQ